jgi:predicted amidohydrolase YtcJ
MTELVTSPVTRQAIERELAKLARKDARVALAIIADNAASAMLRASRETRPVNPVLPEGWHKAVMLSTKAS